MLSRSTTSALLMTLIIRAVPDDARGTALALRLVGDRVDPVGTPAAAGLLAGVRHSD